jgi:hypothetical protein
VGVELLEFVFPTQRNDHTKQTMNLRGLQIESHVCHGLLLDAVREWVGSREHKKTTSHHLRSLQFAGNSYDGLLLKTFCS